MASITWVRFPLSVGQQVSTIPVRVRLSDVTVTNLQIAQERSSSGVSLVTEGGAVVYRVIDSDAHIYEVYVRRSTVYDGRAYVEGELPVGARNAIGVTLRDGVSGVTSETIYISTQPEYPGLTSHVLSEFVDDFESGATAEPIDRGKWTVTGETFITVTKSMSVMTIESPSGTPGAVLLSGAVCFGFPYVAATVYMPFGCSLDFGVAFLRHDSGAYTVDPLTGAAIYIYGVGSESAGIHLADGGGSFVSQEVSISDIVEERGATYYRASLAALYDGSRVVLMGGGRVLATLRQTIGSFGASSMWFPFIRAGVGYECIARVGRIAAYGFSGPPCPAMFGVAEQLDAASEYFEPAPVRAPTSITLNTVYQLTSAGLQAAKRYLLKQIGGYRVSYVCRTTAPTVEQCRYGDPLAPDVPVILTPRTDGIHVWACKTVDGTSDATVYLIPLDGGTV